MGDLSDNLSRYEIACDCGCGLDTIDTETVDVYQNCCDHFAMLLGVEKVIADISSGHRCEYWNEHEGGGDKSQHLEGRAIDFSIRGVPAYKVYNYLARMYPDKYGIGKYETFTHLDTRSDGPARW